MNGSSSPLRIAGRRELAASGLLTAAAALLAIGGSPGAAFADPVQSARTEAHAASAQPAAPPRTPASAPAMAHPALCEYVSTGPSPVLIRGARNQRLRLRATSSECDPLDGGLHEEAAPAPGSRVFLRSAKGLLPGHLDYSDITLDYVPDDLEPIVHFDIVRAETNTVLGSLEVQAHTIALSKLDVRHANQHLDGVPYDQPPASNQPPIAVIGSATAVQAIPPRAAGAVRDGALEPMKGSLTSLQNIAVFNLPAALPKVSTEDDYWVVSNTSWSVSFPDGEPLGTSAIVLPRASEISFVVAERHASPLWVSLALCHSARQGHHDPTDACWFRVEILAAVEARYDRIPFPIGRHLRVACDPHQRPHARDHGGNIVVDHDALSTGKCSLVLTPEGASLLRYFGRQTVKVSTRRANTTPRTTLWELDTESLELPLLAPADDDRGEGTYAVRAEIATPDGQRNDGVSSAGTSGAGVDSAYTFNAALRPRDPSGLFRTWRLYGTLPIDVLTLRMPLPTPPPGAPMPPPDAVGIPLMNVVTLRAGFQIALEPWDYVHHRNRWTVPLRGVIGINPFNLRQMRFLPSVEAGVTVVLGTLFDKISSNITFGAFYHRDLVGPDRAGHLLLKTTVNVFSFFSSR